MQPTWNLWLHLGSTLVFSPGEKSMRQMAQAKGGEHDGDGPEFA
ncbi:uncharacterized protein LOC120293405 [Eucalyptus grandis]|nr:uncharacterized protein LOC120293405 [Eucalyptus grandis]XP_039168531.1 uncharacterized protein LOC120293405 [Eucalyptus grandis]